jgi:hypothetical protein
MKQYLFITLLFLAVFSGTAQTSPIAGQPKYPRLR